MAKRISKSERIAARLAAEFPSFGGGRKVDGNPLSAALSGKRAVFAPRSRTAKQVAVVRKLKGIVGQRELAILCGVVKTSIQKIHQGKSWPEDLRVREFPR